MDATTQKQAERLTVHATRYCARVYRPLLGHEQAWVCSKLAAGLQHPAAVKVLQTLTPYKRARVLIKNARFAALTLIKSTS